MPHNSLRINQGVFNIMRECLHALPLPISFGLPISINVMNDNSHAIRTNNPKKSIIMKSFDDGLNILLSTLAGPRIMNTEFIQHLPFLSLWIIKCYLQSSVISTVSEPEALYTSEVFILRKSVLPYLNFRGWQTESYFWITRKSWCWKLKIRTSVFENMN